VPAGCKTSGLLFLGEFTHPLANTLKPEDIVSGRQ